MSLDQFVCFFKEAFGAKDPCNDMMKAGTGFMMTLTEGVKKMQLRGYTANFSAKYDHLEAEMGKIKLYPQEFTIDKMIRFENASDPDDQSILYAISSASKNVKGLYIESYGTYHDELSSKMLEKMKDHPH